MRRFFSFILVIVIIIISAMLFSSLTGCESSKTVYEMDCNEVSTKVLNTVDFEAKMFQVKESKVGNYLSNDGAVDSYFFLGNGSLADCFGVFSFNSKENADKFVKEVETYFEDSKTNFEYYVPKEAEKIENSSKVIQYGNYVCFAITSDIDAFENILKESVTKKEVAGKDDSTEIKDEEDNDEKIDVNEILKDTYPKIETSEEIVSYTKAIRIGDTAFELYEYNENKAQNYANIVKKLASNLEGKANVYAILAPLSTGITLPDSCFEKIESSNEKKAIYDIKEMLGDKVSFIDNYETLMLHRDEYIYFRTDHHWTELGAYYTYLELCDSLNIVPITKEKRETVTFLNFVGTYFKKVDEADELSANPDKIVVYKPVCNSSLKYIDSSGVEHNWSVIKDVNSWARSSKYSTFIAGDNPYTEIINKDLTDGSSVVVVCDSYGNALVPLLIDHYQKTIVLDPRHYQSYIEDVVNEVGAKEVIVITGLSMINDGNFNGRFSNIVRE